MTTRHGAGRRPTGFTLIELLVVMAILSLLVAIVAPRYVASVDRAKEAALRTDLRVLREAIDKAHSDSNRWPASLQQLVDQHYIRNMPVDPVTDSAATWLVTPSPDDASPGIQDVHSGAAGTARDGTTLRSW